LIHDHRVCHEWAEKWYSSSASPASPAALISELNLYQGAFRDRYADSWADLADVAKTLIPDCSADAPKSTDPLVTVVDLWSPGSRRIWEFAYHNYGLRRVAGMRAPPDTSAGSLPPELAAALSLPAPSVPTIDDQLPVMSVFFEAIAGYVKTAESYWSSPGRFPNLGPFWVTLFDPWRARVTESPEDWYSPVGGSKPASSWLIAVKYPVRRAKRLYLPTQLEAGVFGRHFPSPPSCRPACGGRVVEGRPIVFSAPRYSPLPEFIHAPIALELEDWAVTMLPVRRTTLPVGDETYLPRDRQGHWEGLDRNFSDVKIWMDRPNP
jgi:hypothetical protein